MGGWRHINLAVLASVLGIATVTSGAAQALPHRSATGATAAEGDFCPVGEGADEHAGHSHEGKPEHEARWVIVRDQDVAQVFTFRPARGERALLRYRLDEPALVSIKVKQRGTRELFLATILNWEYRSAGSHAEVFDGLDYKGEPIDMSQASLTILAQEADREQGSMSLEAKSDEETVHGKKFHQHGDHHDWAEEVPALDILQPSSGAVLSGLALIRSRVDSDRRGYGDQFGYGVRYYLDGILVQEEFYRPESDGQFAYRLDTTAFEDGEHVLRLGMCDHNEHVTSVSVPIVVRNASR